MGNEMGNNNTSGLKDEENTTVEACKTSLVDTTQGNDIKEENHLVSATEGKDFHEKLTGLAFDDPERIEDPCVENQISNDVEDGTITISTSNDLEPNENSTVEENQFVPEVEGKDSHERFTNLATENPAERVEDPCIENQTSNIKEQEDNEVHPLGESPSVTLESTDEAREGDSKMQSDTLLSDSGHENPIKKKMEESGLQETMFTHGNDIKEENHLVPEADQVKDFHEKLTGLASDDPERIEDPCIENQTSKNVEEGTISTSHDLEPKENPTDASCQSQASLLHTTQESDTKKQENQVVPEVEGKDFHEKFTNLATDDPVDRVEDPCVENQTLHIKDQEENEARPLSESPKVTLESADEAREEDSKMKSDTSLSASEQENPIKEKMEETDILGTMYYQLQEQDSFKKEDEKYATLSALHDLEHIEANQHESAKIHPDQSLEDGNGSLLVSEDCLGSGLTSEVEGNGHLLASEALANAVEKFDSLTELSLGENGDFSNLEPEAVLESNSQNSDLDVPEHEGKCLVHTEEISGESENGENIHEDNPIQPCGELVTQSESAINKSREPQTETTIIEPTLENNEKLSVISPQSSKDCRAEEPKVADNGGLVDTCLDNQDEASQDQSYWGELEGKAKVVSELGVISTELIVLHFNHKEQELAEKRTDQERKDKTESSHAIEIAEAKSTEQNCLSSQESTKSGSGTLQSINDNDSTPEFKQQTCSEFIATEASTKDCTSWIAEALVSMNKLEAEMLGQQVTQHNEVPQAEAATQTKTSTEVETSYACVCSGSETQETVGRSSTVSTESDPDNLNTVHARIQKSPSFSLDLQNEVMAEESDSSPLLCQDKAAIEISPSHGEKVITLERSQSEDSKTPFLGFLKENQEADTVAIQNKHVNHSPAENSKRNEGDSIVEKAAPNSSKIKGRRRHIPSLFSNCLCCATVIN